MINLKQLKLHNVQVIILSFGLFVQLTGMIWLNEDVYQEDTLYVYLTASLLLLPSIFTIRYLYKRLPWPQGNNSFIIYLAVFFCYVLLSHLWNNGEGNFIRLLALIIGVLLYLLAIIRISASREIMMRLLLLSSFIVGISAFLSIANYCLHDSCSFAFRGERIYRLGFENYADFKNANHAGFYYGAFASFLLGYLCLFKKKINMLFLVNISCIILILFYVYLTGSRNALLSILCSFIFILVTTRNWKTKLILSLMFAAAIPITYFSFSKLVNLIDSPTRIGIWLDALSFIQNRLWFGHGAGYPYSYTFDLMTHIHVHSWYLQAIYEYGVLGLSLFIVFVLELLKACVHYLKSPRVKLYMAMLIYGLVLMTIDVNSIFSRFYWITFWLPIGLLMGELFNYDQPSLERVDPVQGNQAMAGASLP